MEASSWQFVEDWTEDAADNEIYILREDGLPFLGNPGIALTVGVARLIITSLEERGGG